VVLRSRYRIIQPLGGGGFGRTYLAEDVDKLDELCVVKQLAPQVQGSSALQKATELFKQEARRLQHLGEHPQIPILYAYFEEDKRLYLAQQLISGQNLLQELEQQGAFSEQKIRELLSHLLPILQSVHEQQVIHRDIKPENIIRRRSDGKLVLIDFGIAKLATATAMAKTGTTIGSFGYAPIEQIKGGEAYLASDLYSLGATCFHLLTGIQPWQLWTDQGYGWVSDWRQHLKSPLSQELDLVLSKLLQKDITERYPSVEAVLKDLNRLSERSPAARPTVAQSLKQPPQPTVPPTVPPPPQLSPLPPVASAKQNGKFKNTLLVGGAILLLGLVGTQIYGYFRYKLFPSNPIFLITSLPSSIFLERSLTGHSYSVNCVAISPNGQTLVSGSGKTIKTWNLSTGTRRNTLYEHSYLVKSVAISPDGETLVSGSADKTIKIWRVPK